MNNCADEQGGWALGCRIDGGQAEYVRVPLVLKEMTEGRGADVVIEAAGGRTLSVGMEGGAAKRYRMHSGIV